MVTLERAFMVSNTGLLTFPVLALSVTLPGYTQIFIGLVGTSGADNRQAVAEGGMNNAPPEGTAASAVLKLAKSSVAPSQSTPYVLALTAFAATKAGVVRWLLM